MTLRVYSHLYPSAEVALADALDVAGLAITTADLHPADVQRRGMSPHAITSYGCAGLCTLIE